jgi:hypothetical protein
MNYYPNRIHMDDLITAFFSANTDFTKINFFSGIPQERAQWVSQFPTLFFVLQRIFLIFAGNSIFSTKLSVIPYILFLSYFLFLIVKYIFNTKTALISLVLYSFLPISIYLETLGLHFISSTAIFICFFYLSMINLKKNELILSVLSGIACSFCYLFYITSFIAFPFMILFNIFQIIRNNKIQAIKNFIFSLITFLIVLSPYLTYAGKYNNYFFSRIDQVSYFTGSWSDIPTRLKKGENILPKFKENILINMKSFYLDGIGGHGGYNYNHLALFNRSSIILVVIGLIIGIIFIFKKVEILFVILTLTASFSTLIISIPPPAYHRLALSFPFIVIIMSIPLYLLLQIHYVHKYIRYFIIICLLFMYIYNNQIYFMRSIINEKDNSAIKLAAYINDNYPDRNIYCFISRICI